MGKNIRHIVVLLAAMMLTLGASAQIQKDFFNGCVMGVSTKKQVSKNMQKQGYERNGEYKKGIAFNYVNFAGVSWDRVEMYFENDVLYTVIFLKYEHPEENLIVAGNAMKVMYPKTNLHYDEKENTIQASDDRMNMQMYIKDGVLNAGFSYIFLR